MLHSSPVSMGDSEPAIMSEFSSDTDPDMEDELCRFQPLQAPVSPLSTTTSVGGWRRRRIILRRRCPSCPQQSPLRGGLLNRSGMCTLLGCLTCFWFMNSLRIRRCTSQRRRRLLLHSRRALCSSWKPSLFRGVRRLWIASSLMTLPCWIGTRTCRCCRSRCSLCQMTSDSYRIQPWGSALSRLMACHIRNRVPMLFLLQQTCPGRGLSMHTLLRLTLGISR